MDLLHGLLLLIGTAAVGWLIWRGRRSPVVAHVPVAEVPPDVAPEPDHGSAGPDTPGACAAALSADFQASAHPRDVESHPMFQRGMALLSSPQVPVPVLADYCVGPSAELATMAAAALTRRADGGPAVPLLVANSGAVSVWVLYFLLRAIAAHAAQPVAWLVLMRADEWWARNPLLPGMLDEFVAHRLAAGEEPDLAAAVAQAPAPQWDGVMAILERLGGPAGESMRNQYRAWRSTYLDRDYLESVGRILLPASGQPIVEYDAVKPALDEALAAILQGQPASLLVLGDPGVGKTAFVQLLARRLERRGWTVFEASSADLQAGQTYLGELEGRMRKLFDALEAGRRVVWYVPRVHELHYAGRHHHSPVAILDLLLPMVESGRVCVVGESSQSAIERVLSQRPRMRTAFKSVVMEPLDPKAALSLARGVADARASAGGATVPEPVLEEALDLACHYLNHQALPGSLLDLLQRVEALSVAAKDRSVTRAQLVRALAEHSGLPLDVIDDAQGLDVAGLRARFEARVLGQPAAVECLVDRIAMMKAGLTDPLRPVGVFLFAGPTGTGKTEVAKVLAEFLFGSVDRMIRLDMSEMQEASGLERILGESGQDADSDALVHRIRKQPFSLVLLDEFEKAHPRVWDLFLQVFDDGRLTDARGNPADFRHAIIILTSNLGAVAHASTNLGFSTGGGAFAEAQVVRAIAATFRPEFVNRIDRVVVFRPLSRLVMRDILRKELRLVLERRGFRNREWAVEWEESAIEFLLDKGFTPDMGARPLRRAIEQYVLGPIATTIVEHRFPEGDQFLFVRSDGQGVQVEFVDPDAPTPSEAVQRDSDADFVDANDVPIAPAARQVDPAQLSASLAALEVRLATATWRSDKQALLDAMAAPGFWNDDVRYDRLDRLERVDRIEAGVAAARSLHRRLQTASGDARSAPATLRGSLAERLHLLRHAIDDLDAGRASEVFLAVEAVGGDASAAEQSWVRLVAGMYQAWAAARRMKMHLLSDARSRSQIFACGGFGAHGILAPEAGLHVHETPDDNGGFTRISARVRVAPQPTRPRPGHQSALDQALWCLGADGTAPAIVIRRYRSEPSPLVRDSVRGWRTGRLDQVLKGHFDLIG